MTEILFYGDCIINDIYFPKSSFSHINNYFSADNVMLSVSDDIDFAAPNSIIVNSLENLNSNISLKQNRLQLNNIELELLPEKKYNSAFIFKSFTQNELTLRIEILEQILQNFSDNFLTLKVFFNKKIVTKSAFETEIYNRLSKGFEMLKQNAFFDGLQFIKGIGSGLTPSGDDFIAGVVMASYFAEKSLNKNLQPIRNSILKMMSDSNIYSFNFLRYLVSGNFNAHFKDFLTSFSEGKPEQMQLSVEKMKKIGASSGIDVLVGFIFTLKYIFYAN